MIRFRRHDGLAHIASCWDCIENLELITNQNLRRLLATTNQATIDSARLALPTKGEQSGGVALLSLGIRHRTSYMS